MSQRRGFDLDNYVPVSERLVQFWATHPDGAIITDAVEITDTRMTFRAEAWANRVDDDRPLGVGYASETPGQGGPVNQTNPLENAETSAIGRALANCGFQTGRHRPSREEMESANRRAQRARPSSRDDDGPPIYEARGYESEAQLNEVVGALVARVEGLDDADREQVKQYRRDLDYAWPPTPVQCADLHRLITELYGDDGPGSAVTDTLQAIIGADLETGEVTTPDEPADPPPPDTAAQLKDGDACPECKAKLPAHEPGCSQEPF